MSLMFLPSSSSPPLSLKVLRGSKDRAPKTCLKLSHVAVVHRHANSRFEHRDAYRLSQVILRGERCVRAPSLTRTNVIDLTAADDATTSAFAHLILLRRAVLRAGGDVRLSGLRDRAARVYAINRLAGVLPLYAPAEKIADPTARITSSCSNCPGCRAAAADARRGPACAG